MSRVPIRKEILLWAIRESGKPEEEISAKYPKIERWINGDEHPTFKQAEEIAAFLQIPFGFLFLDNPPQDPAAAEFRALPGELPAMSKNLKDTILEMAMRRNWMSRYRRKLGWDQLEIAARFREQASGEAAADASLVRKLLELKDKWHEESRDLDAVYNLLKKKLESAGILVMQSGIVGTSTRRRLDADEFRAFTLSDPVAPLIFINRSDTKTGRVFSLVYQFAHVLFEQDYLFAAQDADVVNEEGEISALAVEFIMPEAEIRELWDDAEEVPKQIGRLSRLFKVSKQALAARLERLGLISGETAALVIGEDSKAPAELDGQGGESSVKPPTPNYYRTYSSRISPAFKEAVIKNAEAGAIEYTYAFKLLGVNGKSYDKVKEGVMANG
ncbi:MAG: ImmA/IrrE family metallo-endopeptidase [Limnochordia bacterium]